jgi:hypothetical protein
MHHNMTSIYLLAVSWLMALNPDPISKWLACIASISVIASSYYNIRKNRKK